MPDPAVHGRCHSPSSGRRVRPPAHSGQSSARARRYGPLPTSERTCRNGGRHSPLSGHSTLASRPHPVSRDLNPLEESAEDLFHNAPCGYLTTLPDGTIVQVNTTFL